jgi:hypothetical protein
MPLVGEEGWQALRNGFLQSEWTTDPDQPPRLRACPQRNIFDRIRLFDRCPGVFVNLLAYLRHIEPSA